MLETYVISTTLALFCENIFVARYRFLSEYRLLEEQMVVDYEKRLNGQTLKQAFVQVHMHFSTCEDLRKFIKDQGFASPDIFERRKKINSSVIDKSERDSHFMMIVRWQLVRSHPGEGSV